MNIGQKLLDLRKSKQLSQEEVANILNVTRQTVSKWETDQSMPDFDKILPICELYEISADELLSGIKSEKVDKPQSETDESKKRNEQVIREKRAKGIGLGVILFFVAVVWIMVSIPVQNMDPIVATAGFILICGIATYVLIYTNMVYKKEKTVVEEEKENKLQKQINEVIAIIVLVIYLAISFMTMAWHITWILWVVYALIEEIVKLIFILRGKKDGE